MSSTTSTPSAAPATSPWRQELGTYIGLAVVLIAMVALFSALSDYFFTKDTLLSIANEIPALAVMAVGMTFILIIAGIDLSVGSVLALSAAAAAAAMMQWEWGPWGAAVLGLLVGVVCGAITGGISVAWQLPSFIVSLGMLEAVRGGAYLVTDSRTQYVGDAMGGLATPWVAGLSASFFIAILVVIIGQLLLSRTVTIEGRDVTQIKEPALSDFRRSRLGFLFQDFNLLDTMTLQENIVLPLALAKTPHEDIRRRLDSLAQALGITDVLAKRPYEVSGGQKQRAAAARAIITDPALVLADEPTGALDSKSARELLGCLERLNAQRQATILMVTHDAFSASWCSRIVFIKDGLLFNELRRGDMPRKAFYQSILQVLSVMGGGNGNAD